MRFHELIEAEIPYSHYGYWASADGAIIPVRDEHLKAVSHLGMDTDQAVDHGWIRIIHSEGDWIVCQYNSQSVTVPALKGFLSIVTAGRYRGDDFKVDLTDQNKTASFTRSRELASFIRQEIKDRR